MLPLLNSLTHLTYLTSTSPRIRDILVNDGGLERLLEIMQESALPRDHCSEPNFDWFGLRGPPTASILTQAQQVALKHSLAFQCVVNIGVRGSETIRTRLVQSGALNVVAQIMEVWLQQKGVWIYPGPLGSQISVERAIAAGVLPPVQDGSIDWRAGYTSRRAKDKERERALRETLKGDIPRAAEQALSATAAQEASRGDPSDASRDMSVDVPQMPVRSMRRPPSGRERHERISAWVEGRGGRPEDGQPRPNSQTRPTRDNSPYPIASWWNSIRRGIELNLTGEDIPTEEDISLFGITPATVPAWTRLFASVRTAGDNRRRLIRRLLRADSSAQSIMEIMFMYGLDPWATKERLQRAVRVSPQGEVMIVTFHRNLGSGHTANPNILPLAANPATILNSQTSVQHPATILSAPQLPTSTSHYQMEDATTNETQLSMPTPRTNGNHPLVELTAPAAPLPIPNLQGRRDQASIEEFDNDHGDSSAAQSVSSTTSDIYGAEPRRGTPTRTMPQMPTRGQLVSRFVPPSDSATSSRSNSRLADRSTQLLDVGNDANSSGPSNNPSPISTPRNGEMPRGSGSRVLEDSTLAVGARRHGRERSGTITNATGFEIASENTIGSRLARRPSMPQNHDSMDIDEEDLPASRATTDAEMAGPGAERDDDAVDEGIDIVGINGEEEIGDPTLNVLTEVEPNPDAQAELDIAMGAPRGAPGAAATTVAGEMTPRVPAAGLPSMTANTASPEPVNVAEIENNEALEGNAQRQPIRQAQVPVTAVVIAAGAPRSFSDLGHLVASMDRNADPHVYTDDTILLSLQLFAYLSKYPHVRSAFHHPTRPLHYGVEISAEANLPERPNFAKTNNMFSLVERFTFRAAPPDPDMPKIPADIQCNAREHETTDLGLAGTVIIPPGDRSSEFVQAQHARQRQSRFTLAMNTRQNVPIGNDEQPVTRTRPIPVTRRDAVANTALPHDTAARPDSIPGTTRRGITRVDLTDGRPGLPRRNETVIGMDVDRERTLEPMEIDGLGMGVTMGLGGMMEGQDADGTAGLWNVHGVAAFGL
ncbi:hypothetical protein QFC19_004509 [Naganishia cerealis]|uniref:Uncharacterized protein n=1 Tax=Naganishia cerealis TaxID=610337 RepID=A0ACC2VU71_9TREE|nr:hypothetical protein QFC19_004509 [Naganishia cerealis]